MACEPVTKPQTDCNIDLDASPTAVPCDLRVWKGLCDIEYFEGLNPPKNQCCTWQPSGTPTYTRCLGTNYKDGCTDAACALFAVEKDACERMNDGDDQYCCYLESSKKPSKNDKPPPLPPPTAPPTAPPSPSPNHLWWWLAVGGAALVIMLFVFVVIYARSRR